MLSDLDDELPPVKVTFKKKGARLNRRKIPIDESEPAEPSLFATKPKTQVQQPQGVSRWARYAALGNATLGNAEPASAEKAAVPDPEAIPGDYTVADDRPIQLSSENTAYTIAQNQTNTFSLKQSHFRDNGAEIPSLRHEYADAYGNVLEDELAPRDDLDIDARDDFVMEDTSDTPMGDIYDMAVSPQLPPGGGHVTSGPVRLAPVVELSEVAAQLQAALAALKGKAAFALQRLENVRGKLVEARGKRQALLGEFCGARV